MKMIKFGETQLGLPIHAFHWNWEQKQLPLVLVMGGVHGDEPEGVVCARGVLEKLRNHFDLQIRLMIIPEFNPEGVLLKTRGNARKVDLNRNLPTKDWSPIAATERYYPGPSAASEKENQYLIQWLDSEKPELIFSLHSWKPMLNVNGSIPEAQIIAKMTGYTIEPDIGYPTPGSLGTYAGLERHIPTLTYEIERDISFDRIMDTHVDAVNSGIKIRRKSQKMKNFNTHVIENLYDKAQDPSFQFTNEEKDLVNQVLKALDEGAISVCESVDNTWVTHQWIKKSILMYFKISGNKILNGDSDISYFDKVPVKKWTGKEGVRVVPPAIARYGSFLEPGCIMMPGYVNIGAYVGSGTMVDTWATVGSCAQIGKNVHLSGGVGIGGVLEPAQAQPVIIEDDCFIGSRCIVVEGVHLEKGVVLGAGVTLTSTTKIIDVTGDSPLITRGRVPENSVVIPGTETKKFNAGEFGVPAALIYRKRKDSTNKKTSLNQALRDYNVSI